MIIIKKILALLGLGAIIITCSGCTQKAKVNEPEPAPVPAPVETKRYMTTGRYYDNGSVITKDGNVWDYQTETISDKPAYDSEPVYIVFNDNGTETIYDDAIIGLVLDRETAIYDALEMELSTAFELERDGNNIKLVRQK